jgi:hypothetical protein
VPRVFSVLHSTRRLPALPITTWTMLSSRLPRYDLRLHDQPHNATQVHDSDLLYARIRSRLHLALLIVTLTTADLLHILSNERHCEPNDPRSHCSLTRKCYRAYFQQRLSDITHIITSRGFERCDSLSSLSISTPQQLGQLECLLMTWNGEFNKLF